MTSSALRALAFSLLAMTVLGCGLLLDFDPRDESGDDAGQLDAGSVDGGRMDGGPPRDTSIDMDTGVPIDGELDAAPADVGSDAIVICLLICAHDEFCCGVKCTDLQNDIEHCGFCGDACDEGEYCHQGRCVECDESNVCDDDARCTEAGRCVSLCDGITCPEGTTCCEGECVSFERDPANCGECGKTCRANEQCRAGSCSCGGLLCNLDQKCCQSLLGLPLCAPLDVTC